MVSINQSPGIISIHPTGQAVESPFQRLSSGLKIQAPESAAAPQSLGQLNPETRFHADAIRQLNEEISFYSLARAGLQELSQIAERQRDLADQVRSGAHTAAQREAIEQEANLLVEEYNSIIASTEFNGVTVLSEATDGDGVTSTMAALELAGSANPESAITAIDGHLQNIKSVFSSIAARTQDLEFAVKAIGVARENYSAAAAAISDITAAEAAADQVQRQILADSGTAMLAQANQEPESALGLFTL